MHARGLGVPQEERNFPRDRNRPGAGESAERHGQIPYGPRAQRWNPDLGCSLRQANPAQVPNRKRSLLVNSIYLLLMIYTSPAAGSGPRR